mmetsp:Transcript_6053/g.17492  ORF Transcript_6053/g.17492 Transcript_6053/m.17492 type:complete len:315 (+) Transcript_6053:572-1516(+)
MGRLAGAPLGGQPLLGAPLGGQPLLPDLAVVRLDGTLQAAIIPSRLKVARRTRPRAVHLQPRPLLRREALAGASVDVRWRLPAAVPRELLLRHLLDDAEPRGSLRVRREAPPRRRTRRRGRRRRSGPGGRPPLRGAALLREPRRRLLVARHATEGRVGHERPRRSRPRRLRRLWRRGILAVTRPLPRGALGPRRISPSRLRSRRLARHAAQLLWPLGPLPRGASAGRHPQGFERRAAAAAPRRLQCEGHGHAGAEAVADRQLHRHSLPPCRAIFSYAMGEPWRRNAKEKGGERHRHLRPHRRAPHRCSLQQQRL